MKKSPTDGELAILSVLWSSGPCTVREVHGCLNRDADAAYTTTLKLMQIMLEKGLVHRDASKRSHVYQAAISQSEVQGSMLTDLVQKAFGGSASRMVLRALSSKKASPQELEEIRTMLDELEREARS